MSDNKKYYYLKLKDNFFDSEEMIILQNMKDGYIYSDILLKLYLRSLKDNGKLMFREMIPYTPEVIAQIVRHQVGTVKEAINIFKELGLIEILDNGAIYMLEIQNLIGKSSTEADRVRNYRNKIKEEQLLCTNVQLLNDKTTPEIEKEKEIEIEIEIDNSEKISEITKTYEDNIGLLTPAAADLIFSYLDDFKDYRIIIEAIKTASTANIRTAKYINGILRSWLNKGYKVLADVQNEQKQKTEKQEEKPKKNYKEIDTSILTEEEYADIVRGKTTYEEIIKRKGVQQNE